MAVSSLSCSEVDSIEVSRRTRATEDEVEEREACPYERTRSSTLLTTSLLRKKCGRSRLREMVTSLRKDQLVLASTPNGTLGLKTSAILPQ